MASKTKVKAKAKATSTPQAARQSGPATPLHPAWAASAAVLVVGVALVATLLVFTNNLYDVYSLPKAFVLLVAGVVVLGIWLAASGASGAVELPRSRAAVLYAAVLAVMTLATLLNGRRSASLFGEYARSAGLLSYVAAGLLFAAVLVYADGRAVTRLVGVFGGVGAVVILYGVLQVLGAKPFDVPQPDLVTSTLGQINFLAGFTGIVLPVFLWVAARPGPAWLRAGGAALAVATVVVGVQTTSFQAYGSIGAAVALFAVVWALERWDGRRVGIAALAVVLLSAVALLALHDKVDSQVRSGMDERVLMWQAGGQMVQHRPVLGYGPSGYAAEFSTYRPTAHAQRFGLFQVVDAPHDVPLSMAVTGGGILLLLYLAFVGVVGSRLLRGLRRLRGEQRLLLAAVGGAWLAYQVQSLISIDVPSLILCHLFLAACVLLVADGTDVRVVAVPALVTRQRGRQVPSALGRAVQAVAGVLVLAGIIVAVRPVMADVAFLHGTVARASGDDDAALADFKRATDLAPWIGRYWAGRAGALVATGDQDGAVTVGIDAAKASPSAVSYALSEAQLAQRLGRNDLADEYFRYAIARSPKIPDVYRARADFLVATGKYRQSIPILRKVIAMRFPAVPDQVALANAYLGLGDEAEATKIYRLVLKYQPTNRPALLALGLAAP